MDIGKLQDWVKTHFSQKLDPLSLDYGVARLLTQTGQLGEAVLTKGDVSKEITDVLFVLAAIANRAGVDLNHAVATHLTNKEPAEFFARLDTH